MRVMGPVAEICWNIVFLFYSFDFVTVNHSVQNAGSLCLSHNAFKYMSNA